MEFTQSAPLYLQEGLAKILVAAHLSAWAVCHLKTHVGIDAIRGQNACLGVPKRVILSAIDHKHSKMPLH